MKSTSRATALLVAAAATLVLAQAASAAQLGLTAALSPGEDAVAPAVNVEVSAAGVSAAASADSSVPSVSAAVQTSDVGARIHTGAGAPAADDPPASAGGSGKGSEPRKARARDGDSAARDRSAASPPSAERAFHALQALELPPMPLASQAAKSRPLLDELAPLPRERSEGGWWSSIEAAGGGVSGSPFALLSVLLVAVALFLQAALGAVRASRPSLLTFVLQRPG